MKYVLFIGLFAALAWDATGQGFHQKHDIALPDSIVRARSTWVDLNNDGQLDVALAVNGTSGHYALMFIKGDTIAGPQLQAGRQSIIACDTFALVDYNRDNRMDVIVSGNKNGTPSTALYLNKGNFQFDEQLLNIPTFSSIKFADLDGDARVEIILSGHDVSNAYTTILKQRPDESWAIAHDSLKVDASALEIFDADGDGDKDIFLSGVIKPDSLFTGFLINQGSFYFKPQLVLPLAGTASAGDMNGDGAFDIFFAGRDRNHAHVARTYLSQNKTFQIASNSLTGSDVHPYVADFNSDGATDICFLGKNATDVINIIRYKDHDETLPVDNLQEQHPGDEDHDGDLDILQIIRPDSLHVMIYENKTLQKNQVPGRPFNPIAVRVYDRLFIFWEKPADDHTATNSLTYDVSLRISTPMLAGDFNLVNEKRLTVTHGNNGTSNFNLWNDIPAGTPAFSIQAIDNALNAGNICNGSGAQACVFQNAEHIKVCTKENVDLTAAGRQEVMWFSFSSGYLGKSATMNIQSGSKDTIFYFNPQRTGCDALKGYTFDIEDSIKTEKTERRVCEGATVNLSVEDGLQYSNWKSFLKGDLGNHNPLVYATTKADTLSIAITNSRGCKITRKTAIEISQPNLQATPDHVQIIKGANVQLSVTGAVIYSWTPSTGLDRNDVDNPVASPGSTTRYTVTGYDTIGCSSHTDVTVVVEQTAFIPTLFTPNDDGMNDELKVYGITSASNFNFSLYNREGNLVFKSHDIAEMMQRGWDGTTHGTKQPAGAYFWKVDGSTQAGERILLNGKETGSVFLVR